MNTNLDEHERLEYSDFIINSKWKINNENNEEFKLMK